MDAQKKTADPVRGTAAKQNPTSQYRSATPSTRQGVDGLLSRLERVKRTGAGTWQARCPSHADKSPSLSIREKDDGAVLVHCFGGCSVHEVVAAVGMQVSDLFPERPTNPAHVGKPERRPFPAADILRAIALEASIVALSALAMHKGQTLTDADLNRLLVANSRITAALDAGGLNHA